jgi:hypothetical protein
MNDTNESIDLVTSKKRVDFLDIVVGTFYRGRHDFNTLPSAAPREITVRIRNNMDRICNKFLSQIIKWKIWIYFT